jgi:hypothetical protein
MKFPWKFTCLYFLAFANVVANFQNSWLYSRFMGGRMEPQNSCNHGPYRQQTGMQPEDREKYRERLRRTMEERRQAEERRKRENEARKQEEERRRETGDTKVCFPFALD